VNRVEGLSGAALVTRQRRVELELAQGVADAEAHAPCTSTTPFQLCSVSKQFAAVAVMLLVEAGGLNLEEPVARWLRGGSEQWRQVTLHHLLSHTAGLPHWHEAPGLDPARPMGVAERLEVMQATPLKSTPGSQWHYSSPGFLLVGLIVARASGQPYPRFLAERILTPLHLSETTVGDIPVGAARGYNDGQLVPPWDLGTMTGTGEIWSTAGDLTTFTTALHDGELLSASSLRAMCTAHASLCDEGEGDPRLTTTGYGYGMYVGDFAGQTAFYHSGDNPGYQSLACWLPDSAASVVILANDEAANIPRLLRQLLPAAL
jgi:CubicO group peptidase (beta-lactamase class C family)